MFRDILRSQPKKYNNVKIVKILNWMFNKSWIRKTTYINYYEYYNLEVSLTDEILLL